ncbi:hypothetical protein [Agromyces mediolanus]|uniref:hypothetical protein n=1 Tax=Agromyces mediolanus TaxID=41986 RepID=UPI001E5AD442|nr:hypothetical protein [Agromyces mediolanus]MCD1572268.1 hypothetical protein [Agromyces mediolanus]
MSDIPWDDLWPQIVIAMSTLLAAFLGFLFAGVNDARRDRRLAGRERATRDEERRAAALRARHEFQLATLLELQDAIQLMARLTGRAMHFDHMQARKGQYTQLPGGHSEDMHANGVDVIRLRNRLLDADLRADIQRFESASVDATLSPQTFEGLEGDALESAALARINTFGDEVSRIMDRLGTSLRAELEWRPSEAD